MKERIKLYTLLSLLFLLIFSLSSSASGFPSNILYIAAFLLPTAAGVYIAKRSYNTPGIPLGKIKNAGLLIPLTAPTLLLIFVISYLTSFVIYLLGGEGSSVTLYCSLPLDILNNALLPTILEESLFRLLPLMLIAPLSKRCAIIVSSLFFAFAHISLHSIPYALFAGAVFFIMDLMAESVWPSVILHFINNIISLLWIYGSDDGVFSLVYVLALLLLSLLSAIFILKRREEYGVCLKEILSHRESAVISGEVLFFIIPTLFIAIINIIG